MDTEMLRSRVDRAVVSALDSFIAAQPDPKPTRPEVIRLALTDWLIGLGHLPHRDDSEMVN